MDEVKKQKKRPITCKKRHADLGKLLNKISEDYALEALPQKRYESLLQTYGQEQDNFKTEMVELQSTVERYESGASRAANFIKLVERYTDFTELTQTMLHELIEKIVIYERNRKWAIDSPQTVGIHLNYIGEFMPPVIKPKKLTTKEKAEQAEILKRRDQYNLAYQRSKESGAAKRYYERTNHKKREERKAIKENLFDENFTPGENVFPQAATN